ncbi:hypothetical protein [Jeotgalibacillus campisalis]|nr:hypothetical protein [Jeotgalibacillus campisalis]
MKKVKINPLIIFALIVSSISMALYAYGNFNNQEIAYGAAFTVLFFLFIVLVFYSVLRNKKINYEDNKSNERS